MLKRFCHWYAWLYKGRAWYTKTIVTLISLILLFIIYLGAVDINFLWLFGKSPGYFSGIRDPQTAEASEIYSADGKMIGKFFSENRTPVKFEEVAPAFWKALIDTEDERFYQHYGVDPIGLVGAAKDAVVNSDARGASTITQQLAKNMFRVRTQYSTGLLGKRPARPTSATPRSSSPSTRLLCSSACSRPPPSTTPSRIPRTPLSDATW